ncbi:hypothetical protein BKA70DRAFT_1431935 [Coprinopsis sp. MPI-PUGE-AT-0042]|nr:hypothetical protein BKA70DRAFT_1431935 [Coprinopsis sp. MPI-PUGE-AT-0042]
MAPCLPSELVREIVSYFSKAEDLAALRATSLASSALRGPCQEELFSEVNVYKQRSGGEKNIDHHLAGLEILRQNTSLVSYIKAVSVKRCKDRYNGIDDISMPSSMVELVELIATVPIQRFSFVSWEGETVPNFQHAIVAFISSPCLTSLSLTNAPEELLGMVKSPYLQYLQLAMGLSRCDKNPDLENPLFPEAFPSASRIPRMRPASLKVTPAAHVTRLLTAVDLSAVSELTLESSLNLPGNVAVRIIELCASSLRKLTMGADFFVEPGSLSQLRNLEKIIVDSAQYWHVDNRLGRASLRSFLDALPSQSSLSYIELEDFYEGDKNFPGSSEFWPQFASILADQSKYPTLQTVKFRRVNGIIPTLEEWEVKQRGYWRALREVGVVVQMPSHLET